MEWRCTKVCFRSEHSLLISTKVRQKMILRVTTFGTKDADFLFNLICVLLLLQPSQPFSLVPPDAVRIRSLSLFLPKRPTAQQALCLFSPFLIQAEDSSYMYPWMSGTCFLLLPCPPPACTSHSSSPVAGHRKAGTKAWVCVQSPVQQQRS